MRLSIDFDGQPAFEASEVDNVAEMRELATKAKAAGAFPKLLPKQHFRQGHLAAKLASVADIAIRSADGAVADSPFGPSTTQLR